jgi:hypothetical protein
MADLLLSCMHDGIMSAPAEIQNSCRMADRLLTMMETYYRRKTGK